MVRSISFVVGNSLVQTNNLRPQHPLQADVTREDQEKINTFSRLNTRMHDLQAQLKARKRAAEDLEEAGNEAMLLDDETVPFVVGECMVHLPREEVEERLQKRECLAL
jgi:prefoldin subunit 4